jgi:Tfp pilus assembly protein FimT
MKPRSAFTGIELIITVLIIGILTATAAPRVANALRLSRLDAATRRIQADLAWARQSAISRSATQVVQFSTANGSYTVAGRSDLDRASNAHVVLLVEPPYKCTINSATLGADATIIFDRYGQPDSGGTIVVGSGGLTRTVTVNATTGAPTSS